MYERTWLVWSYEHRAWWGRNRCGYTIHIVQAGAYTEEEAREIEAKANWLPKDGFTLRPQVNEQAIPIVGDVKPILTGDVQTDRLHELVLLHALEQRDALYSWVNQIADELLSENPARELMTEGANVELS